MKPTAMTRMFAAAALVGMLAAPAIAAPREKSEIRLAERLEGRVAGEPVNCIDLHRVRSSTIYDRTAIVFESGSTIYVNRPDAGNSSLRRDDIMVTKPTMHRLCNVDTVEMRDSSGFYSGSVFLGDFVPYRKAG